MRLNSSQNDAKLRLDGFCESLKGEGKKLLLDTNPTTNSLIVFVLKKTEGNFRGRLATGICTVRNDNPKAFKWWRELVSNLS